MPRVRWVGAAAGFLLLACPAWGVYLDEGRTVLLSGRFSTQASIRTADPKGLAVPEIPAGNLAQNRYVADLDLHHDVLEWLRQRYGSQLPFSILGYRVRVKPTYEGVTDYGPAKLDPQDHPSDQPLKQLDHERFSWNAYHYGFPWNAYIDIGVAPVSLRIGRQDLSWGETDAFRLLDMIEPLDNRFGFPLIEELDDRRIPLWMARLTSDLSFLSFGPFSNMALDTFFVPGTIDNQETPLPSSADPFAPNLPPASALGAATKIAIPAKSLDASRAGIRISTGLFNRYTLSLADYYTYNDNAYPRLIADASRTSKQLTTLEFSIHQMQVSGLTLTGPVPYDPLTIFRVEGAMFWDEAMAEASDLSNRTVTKLIGQSLRTNKPATTDFRYRNVARWMIGLDRNVWIRWLNPQDTVFVSGQYFHTHVNNHTDQTLGLIDPEHSDLSKTPRQLVFDPVYTDEILFTLTAFTYYWGGKIQPNPIVAYDPRGVWAVVPGVNFFIGSNWVVSLKYSNVSAKWHYLGFFQDRDVAYMKVQYNL
jgi:hypothetical protein